MTPTLNETTRSARRSFVETANAPNFDYPIQNLPYGDADAAATFTI
jgi:hypothetical protein